MSTYAWSLLTNRKFLIKMKHPCPLDEILEPNEIKWNEQIPNEQSLSKSQYYLYWDPDYMNKFKYYDLLNSLNNDETDIIEIRTGGLLLNKFSQNKLLHKRIKQLGYKPNEFKLHYLMHSWYNKLFKLTEKSNLEYNSVYLNKINPNTHLICAQIRIGGKKGPTGILDDIFTNRKETHKFWDLIRTKFINNNNNNRNYLIYVTSDIQEIKSEAKKQFGSDLVLTNDKSSIHIERDFNRLETTCDKQQNSIILDFHLLSRCNKAVVSQSGFGILGVWNRPEPNKDLYIFTNQNLTNDYWNRNKLHFKHFNSLDDLYFI